MNWDEISNSVDHALLIIFYYPADVVFSFSSSLRYGTAI